MAANFLGNIYLRVIGSIKRKDCRNLDISELLEGTRLFVLIHGGVEAWGGTRPFIIALAHG